MATALTSENVQDAWSALTEDVRTAVLLTLRNGRPFGSHVPYIFGSDWTRAYLYLSRLALHTQHLMTDPRVSLFIAEPDGPEKNPLALRRMNFQGEAAILSPDAPSYSSIEDAHFVLGFGQAFVSTGETPSRWVHQKVEQLASRKD